ncbi:MAG: 6-phosphofructokinase [Chloroflexi bacterium]|nr:6-phosphofructokinase [Chloroflexota bacterium]OJV94677.1 MAG: 6-phosphofructokinase [Chloroflexi bacterium 54-19]
MPKIKGNLIIGQSGGATAVINSSLAGAVAEALRHEEVGEIYGMLDGVQGLLQEQLIDLRAQVGTPQKLDELKHTPSAALGMCRYKLNDSERERILAILKKYNIRYFLYAGGNDSADTCHRLDLMSREAGYELHAIGIPKTIDNDLPQMDHCPGYGSIARFLAIATQDSGIDSQAAHLVHPIKLIEVMGRNAGWVAASAVLGKRREEDAPHLIYTPERRLDPARFLQDVQEVYKKYGYCVAVIGETVRGPDGKTLGTQAEPYLVDSFGHKYYHGPAHYLMGLIIKELGITARYDKPGTIQRMSMLCASPVDLDEAWEAGAVAARRAIGGETGLMVTLLRGQDENGGYKCEYGVTALENIANTEHKMPVSYINAAGNFVTQDFIDYALPLIGGPIPAYLKLDRAALVKTSL